MRWTLSHWALSLSKLLLRSQAGQGFTWKKGEQTQSDSQLVQKLRTFAALQPPAFSLPKGLNEKRLVFWWGFEAASSERAPQCRKGKATFNQSETMLYIDIIL